VWGRKGEGGPGGEEEGIGRGVFNRAGSGFIKIVGGGGGDVGGAVSIFGDLTGKKGHFEKKIGRMTGWGFKQTNKRYQ